MCLNSKDAVDSINGDAQYFSLIMLHCKQQSHVEVKLSLHIQKTVMAKTTKSAYLT